MGSSTPALGALLVIPPPPPALSPVQHPAPSTAASPGQKHRPGVTAASGGYPHFPCAPSPSHELFPSDALLKPPMSLLTTGVTAGAASALMNISGSEISCACTLSPSPSPAYWLLCFPALLPSTKGTARQGHCVTLPFSLGTVTLGHGPCLEWDGDRDGDGDGFGIGMGMKMGVGMCLDTVRRNRPGRGHRQPSGFAGGEAAVAAPAHPAPLPAELGVPKPLRGTAGS